MTAPARAISFDLDGTLYRVRRARIAWRLRHVRGLVVALVAARERIRHEAPLEDHAALLFRQAQLVAPSFDWTEAQAEAALAEVLAALPEALTRGARPFRGVRSALEAAHARGLKIAVLSDYAPDEKLALLGLGDLPWAACLSAEETGALKPHRRSFARLATELGLEPETIVHVGDREDADVAGALGAGMRAWRYDRKARRSDAERVFRRWNLNLFSSLFER